MNYVYVKDSEGYVCKKLKSQITPTETIITEQEYKKRSGIKFYEQKFGHGGARENSGRKPKYSQVLDCSMRVSQEEKRIIKILRDKKIDYSVIEKQLKNLAAN